MHYGFVGGENILWSDPELHGQVLPDGQPNVDEEGQYVWTNFGGDKVWPNQQSEFVKINGHSWPPDHAFDGAVHEVELLPEGVVISSPVSEYNGARSVREIRLAERGTRVEIDPADRKAGRCQGGAVALHHLERHPDPAARADPLSAQSAQSLRSALSSLWLCRGRGHAQLHHRGRHWDFRARPGGGAERPGPTRTAGWPALSATWSWPSSFAAMGPSATRTGA